MRDQSGKTNARSKESVRQWSHDRRRRPVSDKDMGRIRTHATGRQKDGKSDIKHGMGLEGKESNKQKTVRRQTKKNNPDDSKQPENLKTGHVGHGCVRERKKERKEYLCVCVRMRERERERETDRQTYIQTERQTDRRRVHTVCVTCVSVYGCSCLGRKGGR